MAKKTPHEILGIPPGSSAAEIQQAYQDRKQLKQNKISYLKQRQTDLSQKSGLPQAAQDELHKMPDTLKSIEDELREVEQAYKTLTRKPAAQPAPVVAARPSPPARQAPRTTRGRSASKRLVTWLAAITVIVAALVIALPRAFPNVFAPSPSLPTLTPVTGPASATYLASFGQANAPSRDIAYHPSEDVLAMITPGGESLALELWETTSGRLLSSFPLNALRANQNLALTVSRVAFSRNGNRIGVGISDGTNLDIWLIDFAENQIDQNYALENFMLHDLVFQGDSLEIAGLLLQNGQWAVTLWHEQLGFRALRQNQDEENVNLMEFSQDGRLLVVAKADGPDNSLFSVIDLESFQWGLSFEWRTGLITAAAFSPVDPAYLALGNLRGDVTVINWSADEVISTFSLTSGTVNELEFHPFFKLLLVGQRQARGVVVDYLAEPVTVSAEFEVDVARGFFTPDGQRVISRSTQRGQIIVWRLP